MKRRLWIAALFAAAGLANAWAGEPGIEVEHAWVRLMPPGSSATAAYMTIVNRSGRMVRIVAAHSPVARRAMFHRTVRADGRMRMEPAGPLELAPGKRLSLKPGGLHLMLMRLVRPLEPGGRVSIVLETGDGGTIEARAIVRDPRGGMVSEEEPK